ncbi:broad substrate specificity ATP-binding cassette transporter ABCG2-like [Puntigrus tetrazona]|uniref:broad substrate specificity ATP-binding cassette transporter ABCG2-like n=1 Tax=Puntigrus tetrazona TaxID=1606681 RepID=UPI001C8A1E23|nr:broad substrate specificity ATP-binding cassette transporter ABCG2-like [Puntigrus tetrazona]
MADTAVQLSGFGDLNNNVSRTPVSTRMSFSASRRGATVSFHDINYSVKMKSGSLCKRKVDQKNILIQLNLSSGVMKPGLNAILGPTGGGKSSFLDVLAARKDPAGLSGEVLIDGAPQPPNFKCLSGYVVQDDVVMGTLTVRENLRFSAALRLPKSISQQEKDDRVQKLLNDLGLSKVADSRVGTELIRGVSGGERKRTSIGMELIFDPPVLFLDEPTTGLDASTANSVLMLLKRIANSGRTIILSIHQPRYSIYRLFDSLTLLVGGRLVYHGSAQDALDYFSQIGYTCEPHNNPADFFLDIINGESTAVALNKLYANEELDEEQLISSLKGIEDRLVEQYKKSISCKQTKSELERIVQGQDYSSLPKSRTITYSTSFCHQFNWVLKRTFRNLILNPQTSFVQIGVMIFLALIVGVIFFGVKENTSGIQNRMGALFFIITNQCFSAMSSAELFITERKQFVHEYISGYYRVSVYFLCKLLSDILTLRTIPAIIISCVAYWMIGLKATAQAFFIFLFSVILVSYTATSMTLAISADQTVVAIASIVINTILVFMMIFSGLLVNLPSVAVWLNWLKYLSIPRYGFVAVEINEFIGLNLCDMRNISGMYRQVCTTGEDFLSEQGIDFSAWGLWQNHLALGIMTIIFLIIAYLKLRFIKKFT